LDILCLICEEYAIEMIDLVLDDASSERFKTECILAALRINE
jgi:hypothetical protein